MLAAPSADQVRALAPDDGVARSGESLANVRHWSGLGRSERAVWGLCQGSGSSPYQVVADLSGPAAKCSCPSRKFPCKHGIGILLLMARTPDALPVGSPPPFAESWLASRETRAQAAETRAARADAPVDEAARAKRIAAREQKVGSGVAELDRWLRDVIRRGLATAKGEGYGFWDAAGARLVDAQASGLARSVRGLGELVNSGDGWADRTLERLGRLHLLASAYGRLDALPEPLRADVRTLVGWTTKEDDLPGESVVEDRWLAIGRTVDDDGERLTTARTWFVGESTGRFALHLSFGVAGSAPEVLGLTGIAMGGRFAFFPGSTPLRVAARGLLVASGVVDRLPPGTTIDGAARAFVDLLRTNPFLESWPVILEGVVAVPAEAGLVFVDADGAWVGTTTPADLVSRVLSASGGHPMTVAGEWLGDRVAPFSALVEGRLVDLTLERPLTRPEGKRAGGPGRWSDLVTMALLGTGRSRTVESGVVLTAVESAEPETAVLATAGARAVERRASWSPSSFTGPRPEPASVDPRPLPPQPARRILRRLLGDREFLLVTEWLGRAGAGGMRIPDEELPSVLSIVGPSVVDPGPRARWLVDLVPELRLAATGTRDTRADWDSAATPVERAAVLAAIRRRDPTEGRELLAADWASLPPDARPKAIGALVERLSSADEPLLERALDERRMETRQAAGDLLARLPGSAFATRMEQRARPLIGADKGKLILGYPDWSDDLARDGIVKATQPGMGERAWWRHQLLAHVDPRRWVEWLGLDVASLVPHVARTEDGQVVLEAWVEAVDQRFHDAAFAAALLEHVPAWVELTRHLEPATAEAWLRKAIRDGVLDPAILAAIPRPWSPSMGRAVIDALTVQANAAGVQAWSVRQAARTTATYLPVELADTFEAALFGERVANGRLVFGEAVDLMRLREQLAHAFDTP